MWWIRFADTSGKIRREKVGSKSAAKALVEKRRSAVREGIKLPDNLRSRPVRFSELAEDARRHVRDHNLGHEEDLYRIDRLDAVFGQESADIPIENLRNWFAEQEWEPATYNRSRTVLYGIYRLGIENKKIAANPAQLLKRKREPDGRVRFLNQFSPDEELNLRRVIEAKFPEHMPELDIALNTGMRLGEQYFRVDWSCVDLIRRDLYIRESKNGSSRHIPLNDEALAAFGDMFARTKGEGPIFVCRRGKRRLEGTRHWFEDAVAEAELRDFTWHDLRHTFASRLVMTGVDLRTVAELLGHKRIQMTMRYAHLAPQHKQDAVNKLAAFSVLATGLQKPRRSVKLNRSGIGVIPGYIAEEKSSEGQGSPKTN